MAEPLWFYWTVVAASYLYKPRACGRDWFCLTSVISTASAFSVKSTGNTNNGYGVTQARAAASFAARRTCAIKSGLQSGRRRSLSSANLSRSNSFS